MKLVVLAGAKKGAKVPIKKTEFVIGRSKECALRAGSEAISRKHCVLEQVDSGVTVRDLGSRNGTYVNDEKIEGTRHLANGDTLRIGPLEFRFEAEGQLKTAKAPKVKTVAEAVTRASSKPKDPDATLDEQDISDWLVGPDASGGAHAFAETLSLRTDDTRINHKPDDEPSSDPEAAEGEDEAGEGETPETQEGDDDGNQQKKKEPGKLPFRPDQIQTKDSREAAAQILRDMARRR